MLRQEILNLCNSLRLNGMRNAYNEVISIAKDHNDSIETIIKNLLEAEYAQKESQKLSYRLRHASFPFNKEIDSFDFKSSPICRDTIEDLSCGEANLHF